MCREEKLTPIGPFMGQSRTQQMGLRRVQECLWFIYQQDALAADQRRKKDSHEAPHAITL
jgi:hypothetical protein